MAARILVIEDNPANLELMNYLLQAFGHTTQTATDGKEGLDAVYRERPDLILCDVQLPRVSGYEVVRQLKSDSALRTVPVVAVTAFAMVGDRDKLLAAGFDGYLAKPIVPETFVKQVEAFLQPEQQAPPAPPPAIPAAQAPAAPAAAAPKPAKRATILAVDNSAVNLALLRSTFEPFGFEVLTAQSPSEGRALARQAALDLILSDVHMPHESGYEFLQSIKADPRLCTIPFVFISSTVLREDREESLPAGAAAFLLRPMEPQVLVAKVESCLQEWKERQNGNNPDR
jgi:two-component system, cell cycle response regulator